ncbi:hypothetical protein L1987_37049 [Smallanthus sonchifolius]|uniref:Uncharacterized protein n=1 Tax=Smallanthus sonchifolius TaxID=185202 RepID=A0ACB9HGI9_9ASTR|nr:hypothetical protein L1987_37049 [Smallanthus sonchifolius]
MVAHAYCHVTPKSTVPISRYGSPDGHDRLIFSLLSRILVIAIDTLISLHTSFSLIVSLSLSPALRSTTVGSGARARLGLGFCG